MGAIVEKSKSSMRSALGDVLVELGEKNRELVVVGADTTKSLHLGAFGEKFPERFVNVGIAEQNMIGVSAGLALYGKQVVCGTYAIFLERAIDQIRNTIAYANLDVKIIGSHGGISAGRDGGSHQTVEDIAIMRAIPSMRVLAPADSYSLKALVRQAIAEKGPFYIRLVRPETENIYTNEKVELGRANTIREGGDLTIIASGIMVEEAVHAAVMLNQKGIYSRVLDMHTIKPIDKDAILKAARETGYIITAEDHNKNGGLYSAVAEVLAENGPTGSHVSAIAVNDTFGESGATEELMAKYHITKRDILGRALRIAGKREIRS